MNGDVADLLQLAFFRSKLTPAEFYNYIIATRTIINKDDEMLAFKVEVPAYGYDIEWFGWCPKRQRWIEL